MADTNFSSIATSGAIAAGGAISATGALSGASLSLTTPLTKANANESLKRVFIHVDFPNTLADGTTYKAPATIDDPAILDEIAESLHELGYARPAG